MNMFEFEFPARSEQFATIRDIPHLRLLISGYVPEFKGQLIYRYQQRKSKYIYAYCKFCSASLHYRQLEHSRYQLTRAKLEHRHSYRSSSKYERIRKLLADLPASINIRAAKAIALHQIEMTQAQFYYFYSRSKNPKLSYPEMMAYLDQLKCQIQTDPFSHNMETPPNLFIMVTPLMKEMFRKYGNSSSFDMTFNVVRQLQDGRAWKLSILAGVSCCRKITPFALVLSTQLTKQRYSQIIKTIFDIMGQASQVVISDEQAAIQSAINFLKGINEFGGDHCLDLFHILRNVKTKLRNKQNLKYFSQLGSAQDHHQFEQKLETAYQAIEEADIPILTKFVTECHRYCFAYLPESVGFTSSTNINEKFHDLLKSEITHETDFSRGVLRTLKVLNRLLLCCQTYTIEKQPFQDYFSLPELKQIRYMVDHKIFRQYIKQASQLIHLELRRVEENEFVVINHKSSFSYRVVNQKCECRFKEKTGLACSHLIKVSIYNKIRLATTIDERWKIFQPKLPTKTQSGRRQTRRRRR